MWLFIKRGHNMLSRKVNVVGIIDTLLISVKLKCYAQNIKTITIYLFHLNIVVSFSYIKKKSSIFLWNTDT